MSTLPRLLAERAEVAKQRPIPWGWFTRRELAMRLEQLDQQIAKLRRA